MRGELNKEKENEKEQPVCYECKKSMHFKVYHSLLKKSSKKIKKKVIIATQSDSENSNTNEKSQEVVNLCFMTHKEEKNFEHKLDCIFEELQNTFLDLLDEFKRLGLKNKEIKNYNHDLIKENDKSMKLNESLLHAN